MELGGVSVDWKPPVREWTLAPHEDDEGEPDLGFHNLPASRVVYADVRCTLAQAYAPAQRTPGAAAKEHERRKHRRYPVVDENQRRAVPFDFVPLVLELHGRWGQEAQAFAGRLAHARAQQLGTDPGSETARIYGVISIGLQRGNASLVLGKAVPSAARRRRRLGVSFGDLGLAGY